MIALLVGEHTIEYQDLFAEIVHVAWKAGAGLVANHRCRPGDFGAVTLERAAEAAA